MAKYHAVHVSLSPRHGAVLGQKGLWARVPGPSPLLAVIWPIPRVSDKGLGCS